jgi:adenylate kinase
MDIPKFDAIFMIGPQGSGKGTQGKVLAERLGYFYWEMGGILREEAKKDTPFGRKVKTKIDAGHLLEDEELFRVLGTELPEVVKHKRILFDGVPRTVPQGLHLISYLRQNGFTQFGAVFIEVPREESVKRLLLRAHHEFRKDDTPEKINFRLDLYEKETKPVLQFLQGVGELFTVDGVGSVEEITERINQAVVPRNV